MSSRRQTRKQRPRPRCADRMTPSMLLPRSTCQPQYLSFHRLLCNDKTGDRCAWAVGVARQVTSGDGCTARAIERSVCRAVLRAVHILTTPPQALIASVRVCTQGTLSRKHSRSHTPSRTHGLKPSRTRSHKPNRTRDRNRMRDRKRTRDRNRTRDRKPNRTRGRKLSRMCGRTLCQPRRMYVRKWLFHFRGAWHHHILFQWRCHCKLSALTRHCHSWGR